MKKRRFSSIVALATMVITSMMGVQAASADESEYHPQLIGAQPATEKYEFAASLLYKDPGDRPSPLRCGGALVDPEWVLTAAHCVAGRNPSDFKVSVGSNDYLGGTVIDAQKFIHHPYWDDPNQESTADIALIRLATPAAERPITSFRPPIPGTRVRMVGWGRTVADDPASISRLIRQLDTELLARTDCTFGDEFDATPGDLCVERGNAGSAGACNGDSGSPLLMPVDGRWRIIGVDSRSGGDECLATDEVFTSTHHYWPWVRGVIAAHQGS